MVRRGERVRWGGGGEGKMGRRVRSGEEGEKW